MLTIVALTILVALTFDFVNGMNDAANSIATIVSTRILSPRIAVLWAAFFNFVALFVFGVPVAKTIGKGIVDPHIISVSLVLSALLGAILWAYFFCARLGIPVSSSHSLIGGLMGVGFLKGGLATLIWSGISKTVLFIFLAPFIGFIFGYVIMISVLWLVRHVSPLWVDQFFRIGQLTSSAAFSIGHGGNDAQKTMGIIALLLFSVRDIPFIHAHLYAYADLQIPFWVEILALLVIALGTAFGGMKIIKTVGSRLTHLKPIGGFSAEIAGAGTLFGATFLGVPVSTTQTIAGAIMGVGTTRRFSAVRWILASNIIVTWALTIPASALLAGLCYEFFSRVIGA